MAVKHKKTRKIREDKLREELIDMETVLIALDDKIHKIQEIMLRMKAKLDKIKYHPDDDLG